MNTINTLCKAAFTLPIWLLMLQPTSSLAAVFAKSQTTAITAGNIAVSGPSSETNWQVTGVGMYTFSVQADFNATAFVPVPPATVGPRVKPRDGQTITTGIGIPGPRGALGIGLGTITGDALLGGFGGWNFDMLSISIAIAGAAPPVTPTTTTRSYWNDPVTLEIGSSDSTLNNSLSIKSGTQLFGLIQGEDPFKLTFEGRFGKGDFSGEDGPSRMWPFDGSVPDETYDLYSIEIFENSLGNIDASVQLLTSPDPNFTWDFNASASQIESLIETANWTKDDSNEIWTLGENLDDLFNLNLINLNESNVGLPAAIGTRVINDAFAAGEADPFLDFGDAPDSYRTLLTSDGPRYYDGNLQRLGAEWDAEPDGQPTIPADGDDLSFLGGFPVPVDDEDGVIFGDSWVDVIFNITRPGENDYLLRAWWDLDQDGCFDYPTDPDCPGNELVIDDLRTLTPGEYTFRYDLGFDPKDYYSRFRLTWEPLGDVPPFGEVFSVPDCNPTDAEAGNCISHGEVEDYPPRDVPEPTSTLSFLALGTLGAASTLKRKLKASQSTEKETTKVG